LIATLENRVADIENADPTEAITKLLDQSRALEASYQAISRVRQLSLTDYL
jgi:flagellin-like hook-associated protein FlgL